MNFFRTSDENRVRVLKRIAQLEPVTEECLGITLNMRRGTLRQHLSELERADLIVRSEPLSATCPEYVTTEEGRAEVRVLRLI